LRVTQKSNKQRTPRTIMDKNKEKERKGKSDRGRRDEKKPK